MAGNIKHIRSSAYDVNLVPVDKVVRREGWNTRRPGPDLDAHIEALTSSILLHGYDRTQPMSGFVEGDTVVIVKGHCRSTAVEKAIAQGAEITHVPVILEPKNTSAQHMKLDIYKSNAGKNLSQLDQADLFSELVRDFGMDVKEIAKELVISVVQVNNMLLLATASVELQDLIQDGRLSATLAYETMKEYGEGAEDILIRSWELAEKQGKKKTSQRFVDEIVAMDAAASAEPVVVEPVAAEPEVIEEEVPFDIDDDVADDEEPVDDLIEIGEDDLETIDDEITEEEILPGDDADVTPAKKANGADGAPKLDLRTAKELLANFARDYQKLADLAEAGDKDALADAVNDLIYSAPDVLDNLSIYGITAE